MGPADRHCGAGMSPIAVHGNIVAGERCLLSQLAPERIDRCRAVLDPALGELPGARQP